MSQMEKDLADRVILVTGASRGIGRATALLAAERGAHVIALARTQGALEELDDEIRALGSASSLVAVDLTDFDALDRLGGALYERWGRLDGLVANAAMLGPLSPIGHIRPRDFDKIIATNLTAQYRLLRSMDPLLRASENGRVVGISSGAARSPKAFWGSYAASKAGLDALLNAYAEENVNTNLRVNIVNPGPTRTAMRAKAMPGEDEMTLPTPDVPARVIVDLLSPANTAHNEWITVPRESENA